MGLLTIISDLFNIYSFLIVAYCLLSWFPGAYNTKLGQLLIKICQPYLRLFDFIPPIAGISFAPLVALIVLQFVERGVFALLALLGLGF
ncbi:YggT family protein [Ligilactobacillus faecis]|uniref:YggT family protein n=1 Tax=Ligilactobacillus faecis TaxID=762833 RepID=A0ABV4DNF2_9LACO|nr:YggT family protein [Ligilactobacillus faecis]WGN89434.1 YggT family protein [Ligilactobacillus faecis]